MNRIVKNIWISVVCFCLLTMNVFADEEVSFTLGFIPTEKASELTPKAEALAEFLSKAMGMPVNVIVPTAYESLIEGIRFGHIDAAFMDSGPAWIACQKADAEVVLAELKNGSPYYWCEMYVRSDSDINCLEDILNKRIAFTSWTGSSGFIFPIGTMVQRGLIEVEGQDFISLEKSLGQSFSQYVISGGYKQSLKLLIEGKVDAAALAHDAPQKYLKAEDRDKIKPIERLGKVPSHPIVVKSDMPQELKERFINAMLLLNQPEHQGFLERLYGVTGLTATNTEEHLGDFGPAFELLTGVHKKVFAKHK